MSPREIAVFIASAMVFCALAFLPVLDQGYWLAIGVSIASFVALATAWTLFSGPTHYVSLASAAFFGVGAYVMAGLVDVLPWAALLLIAPLVGAALAAVVGLATLRLSGIYFVVFTLGLAELIRQLVTWFQTNFTTGVGLYVFTDITQPQIFRQLLVLCAAIYLVGWLINRSRLGFAMRIIGNDELVAAHCGIDNARAKIILFMISGAFMATVGAVMAPRWVYIEPAIAFNPLISFQVVIMALLGGTRRLWGPLVGVIPFTFLFEAISAEFPNHTSLLIGLAFLLIVYLIPNGVTGLIETLWARGRRLGRAEE
ncbi:MAG: branched-chain amino acid ABC transporter permease [Alphaproteobacteria bacterium]